MRFYLLPSTLHSSRRLSFTAGPLCAWPPICSYSLLAHWRGRSMITQTSSSGSARRSCSFVLRSRRTIIIQSFSEHQFHRLTNTWMCSQENLAPSEKHTYGRAPKLFAQFNPIHPQSYGGTSSTSASISTASLKMALHLQRLCNKSRFLWSFAWTAYKSQGHSPAPS
ncbi:hypothetical protein DFH08DRAFT_885544 [Mycena albidolilacea]|uniref:Uncharacterized protein n=1 Tax=Mycena albidolilacea TaxID=1033008 RepID=A0AAD6ZKZ3_9AGAR|nr:hypothetical protein DFH08DRAFT_885544 [Mycena albidolilacea]